MHYKLSGLSEEDKLLLEEGKILPIMEQFYTIQGEGNNTGKPAYFIRIGGCDVGCHWCDVKESWDASVHPLLSIEDVLNELKQTSSKAVVITGGEPLQYNLDYLTDKLKDESIETFIETSGAYKLSGSWDWICLSPKKTMPPINEIYAKANELKIIVYNKNDFAWAKQEAQKVSEKCILYLQPEWSKKNEMTPLIVEFVKSNPVWRISLQTHKYINIP
jgi:7-carboxy-7-deazaguanine synthase